jgi:hypothetical protein
VLEDAWSGRDRGWRYLAQRIDGSGTPGVWLDNELPLHDVTITDVLSGPPQLSATISPRYNRLVGADNLPILTEWGTAIYAEVDGIIRYGGLLVATDFDGPDMSIEVSGFTSYAKDMGYESSAGFIQTDPLDIVRHIWTHIQAGQDSNIGLQVDPVTTTPVRVGHAPGPTNPDGTASDPVEKPYRLSLWETDDLGGVIDNLATETPFDYHERHAWGADRTQVEHFLEFGYPRIGARRRGLRFLLGENVQSIPTVLRDGADYASHVRLFGAGEGMGMIRAEARASTGRLRRMATIDDKAVTDNGRAQIRARDELASRRDTTTVTDIVVRNGPNAPLGAWGVGDEIRLIADTNWIYLDQWFRVLSITFHPEIPEVIGMSLLRADHFHRTS